MLQPPPNLPLPIQRVALALIALALASQPPATARAQPAAPNILVVLIDDLRWNGLGSTGHPFVQTPHLDRIANEGISFSEAFVRPLCARPGAPAS